MFTHSPHRRSRRRRHPRHHFDHLEYVRVPKGEMSITTQVGRRVGDKPVFAFLALGSHFRPFFDV